MPETKGLSRSDYWLCWAGVAITFALLAFWPNVGLGLGRTAMALFTAAMAVIVPVLWMLRLRNAGRSPWWVLPIGAGLIALTLIATGLAGQALPIAVFPELLLIDGLALLAVTLVIGLLPTKSLASIESRP